MGFDHYDNKTIDCLLSLRAQFVGDIKCPSFPLKEHYIKLEREHVTSTVLKQRKFPPEELNGLYSDTLRTHPLSAGDKQRMAG